MFLPLPVHGFMRQGYRYAPAARGHDLQRSRRMGKYVCFLANGIVTLKTGWCPSSDNYSMLRQLELPTRVQLKRLQKWQEG